LVCIRNALSKDGIQVKSTEKLTLLNLNIALILKLVDFNFLSADAPKFADSIRQGRAANFCKKPNSRGASSTQVARDVGFTLGNPTSTKNCPEYGLEKLDFNKSRC
jgi:hypothetical protein